MISFDEALHIVLGSSFRTGAETIHFTESDGRILAEDVFSDMDMPPFNRSAVDGYACHRHDLGNDLEVLEVIAAGKEPQRKVGKNECSKIMTGAIVPDGCDIVIMVEDAETLASGKIRFTGTNLKENFSRQGEDVRTGDRLLQKGMLIRPQDIAVMASAGHIRVMVSKKAKAGIISTGDELVEPDQKPPRSKIRNSNAYQLISQAGIAGAVPKYYGIAPDNENVTFVTISKAIKENDIVILTGGVSMGDFDFVPAVLEKAGCKILFNRINVQPGKPTTFASHDSCLVFGLPGNPVSSFIQFETLVKPLIQKMMGSTWQPLIIDLPLGTRFERKSDSRMGWVPAGLNSGSEVIPVEYHGSAHLSSMPFTGGVFKVLPGVRILEKGQKVTFRFF
ncbi:MAG TPA: molybdopterin molybdotransferase MoeA [Bacteroidales bacterium]|nr:molybdopterin molybdotransferase MoeA [Bacteroidales bacterium]